MWPAIEEIDGAGRRISQMVAMSEAGDQQQPDEADLSWRGFERAEVKRQTIVSAFGDIIGPFVGRGSGQFG